MNLSDDLQDALLTATAGDRSVATRSADQARWRRCFDSVQYQALVESIRLQTKAVRKLGPGSWWVTERALQQMTPWQVAAIKADYLVPADDSSSTDVDDLCCGLGGDAIAIARRLVQTRGFAASPRVHAVDLDETLLAMLRRNAETALGDRHPCVATRHGDVLRQNVFADRVHVDPDRRVDDRRRTDPESYQPSWSQLADRLSAVGSACVKLAPAADLEQPLRSFAGHADPSPPTHRLWISLGGEVREQTVLIGRAVTAAGLSAGSITAVIARHDGSRQTFSVDPEARDAPLEDDDTRRPVAVGDWLVDPDAAIRGAGLTVAFANRMGLAAIGSPAGYLVSPADRSRVDAATLSRYGVVGRVISVGSADDRRLRRELRGGNLYPGVVKVRGTRHDPAALQRRYRDCGNRPVGLWITAADHRPGGKVIAALTVSDPDSHWTDPS